MAEHRPKHISKSEHEARHRRTVETARRLGFVGHVEYRHVYSQAGGAQYGQSASPTEDLLIVYADPEAFERDADPDDFSLDVILAHERGHQLLARNEHLTRNLPRGWSARSEEIVASLLGSLLVSDEKDQQNLLLKAVFEADTRGTKTGGGARRVASAFGEIDMMGPTKLSTIREHVRKSFKMTDAELFAWLNRQMKVREETPDAATEIVTLRLLRDALKKETTRPKQKRKPQRASSTKS